MPTNSPQLRPSLRLLRILADDTRLRLLLALARSEFTVGELTQILAVHQSNISRHLTQLREGDLVEDRREGAVVYYRWSEALRSSSEIQSLLRATWQEHPARVATDGMVEAVLIARRSDSQDFFDSVAGKYRSLAEPGGGANALLQALGFLVQAKHAVDIGAGEGEVTLALARGCYRVTAVDLNRRMLEILQDKVARAGLTNVDVRQGDAENLPLHSEEADLAILSQVLHHAASPEKALMEMLRILQVGGRFVVLDLQAHDHEWTRSKLGDHWLGFTPQRVAEMLRAMGAGVQTCEVIPVQGGLPVLLLIGNKLK